MSSFCSFLSPLVGPGCILLVYLWAFRGFFFDEYILPFTHKKNKQTMVMRGWTMMDELWGLDKLGYQFVVF